MKKILVGIVIASFLLVFQIVSVHGTGFSYKEKLNDMISSVENLFIAQKDFISDFFRKQQDDRYNRIEDDLALIYEEISAATTNDVKQYKRSYLLNLTESGEKTQLSKPFAEYTKQKSEEIESEISGDIAAYLSELLEQDKNQIMNKEGETR